MLDLFSWLLDCRLVDVLLALLGCFVVLKFLLGGFAGLVGFNVFDFSGLFGFVYFVCCFECSWFAL